MRRWLGLLPLIMLALAALACNNNFTGGVKFPLPLLVVNVAADTSIPGKAYTVVSDRYQSYTNNTKYTPYIVYETTDYGQTWHETNKPFLDSGSNVGCFMRGNDLYIGDKLVWSFPRPVFRSVFLFKPVGGDPFQLPANNLPLNAAFSPADPSVLYILMGTEGVLVGPNPNSPGAASRPWILTHNGMTDLHPHTLMINASNGSVFFAVGAIVALPFLLYAWLLTQVWRYSFPANEQHRASALASALSIVLGVIAWLAVCVWLLDDRIEVSLVMATASVFIMMISSSGLIAIWLARSRHFTNAFTLRFAFATGLLSLIIPMGIIGSLPAWVLIIFGVIGFMFYRGCTSRYLERRSMTITQWSLDRLAMELTIPILMILCSISGLDIWKVVVQFNSRINLVVTSCVILLSLASLTLYIKWRGKHMLIKKKAAPAAENDTLLFRSDERLFQDADWWSSLMLHALGWMMVASSMSYALVPLVDILSWTR